MPVNRRRRQGLSVTSTDAKDAMPPMHEDLAPSFDAELSATGTYMLHLAGEPSGVEWKFGGSDAGVWDLMMRCTLCLPELCHYQPGIASAQSALPPRKPSCEPQCRTEARENSGKSSKVSLCRRAPKGIGYAWHAVCKCNVLTSATLGKGCMKLALGSALQLPQKASKGFRNSGPCTPAFLALATM